MALWQLIAGIALLIGIGVSAQVLWLRRVFSSSGTENVDRLLMSPIESRESFARRVLLPLVSSMGQYPKRVLPASQIERVRFQLSLLGYFIAPEIIWGLALLLGLAGAAIGFLLLEPMGASFPGSLIVVFGFAVGGMYSPQIWLNRRQRALERTIRREFPGVIDIMRSCMVAGLTFDSAMAEIATHRDTLFGREFSRILDEIKLGRTRAEALKAFSDRLDVDDVTDFVEGVLRSLPLGAPISNIFEVQSKELRRRRIQRAEEAAQKTPIKIMLPMVGCMLPAIFAMLMGPAVISVIGGSH